MRGEADNIYQLTMFQSFEEGLHHRVDWKSTKLCGLETKI